MCPVLYQNPLERNEERFVTVSYVRDLLVRVDQGNLLRSVATLLQIHGALETQIPPGQWTAIRFLDKVIKPLDTLLTDIDAFLQAILDGLQGVIDKIVAYIEGIQARIYQLQALIEKIRNEGFWTTVNQVRTKLGEAMPMGYSSAGVVVSSGAGVQRFKVGDRVATNGPHAGMVCIPQNLCARVPEDVDASLLV